MDDIKKEVLCCKILSPKLVNIRITIIIRISGGICWMKGGAVVSMKDAINTGLYHGTNICGVVHRIVSNRRKW
jgi:hypothetical protein